MFQNSLFFLRLHGVSELINQPMDQMLNSQNVETNNNPLDVLGKKRYLTSYNPKIKAQKIPASRGFCLLLLVCLFFPTESFGWLATSCLCFVSRHGNDTCYGITDRRGSGGLPIMGSLQKPTFPLTTSPPGTFRATEIP